MLILIISSLVLCLTFASFGNALPQYEYEFEDNDSEETKDIEVIEFKKAHLTGVVGSYFKSMFRFFVMPTFIFIDSEIEINGIIYKCDTGNVWGWFAKHNHLPRFHGSTLDEYEVDATLYFGGAQLLI